MGGDGDSGSSGRVASAGNVELFLIAHCVRGEAAFDVATKMECPECGGSGLRYEANHAPDCPECDDTGFWWIIPTSGHRAYPWRWWPLDHMECIGDDVVQPMDEITNGIPNNWPDHYPTRSAPTLNAMEALLGSIAPARGGFRRRF